jgi:ATP-dependent Clp protease ATP-binding subunit ClpB
MTSNIGSSIIQENMVMANTKNADEIFENTRRQVFELVKKSIRPEFLNRLDEIIMFKPLSLAEIKQVVEIQLDIVRKVLEKNNITFSVTPKAISYIGNVGFDPQYGARPIKRIIQKQILNEISKMILAGHADRGSAIEIDELEGKLIFRNN